MSYTAYLEAIKRPYKSVARLEFLQPDYSVAFALDNNPNRVGTRHDSRAFLQGGSLSVSLQNGARRQASVTLANLDGAYDYAVNKIWFGNMVRLSMGIVLPDGTDFYLPQGVFGISEPSFEWNVNTKTATYNLVDKWAYLDGSLGGNLEGAYQIPAIQNGVRTNVFAAMRDLLAIDKYTLLSGAADVTRQIDPIPPVFTSYYFGKNYDLNYSDGTVGTSGTAAVTDMPFDVTSDGTFADLLLALNDTVVGLIGYDATGALRVEPSQEDVNDANKPILHVFSPENMLLSAISETASNTGVYNDIVVAGESLTGIDIWGRAANVDPTSDTNIYRIGRKVLHELKGEYWNAEQCAALAEWKLKRSTVLQKKISITCAPLYHLRENALIAVKRSDKEGSPVERHVIQGFTIPIAQTGTMSIEAVSVNDIPNFTVEKHTSNE